MNVTLITTVLNEEKNIRSFLDSVLHQSRRPDELIIVDAGSKDKTSSIIKNYEGIIPGLKLIRKKGNRAVGRNKAIKNAKNSIIACSDVGCILKKKWLEEIISPFNQSGVDVVSGYYIPLVKDNFQKALASYTSVMPDKVDKESFLPSSRSIAFRKEAWKKVKGYPENLDFCEDLVFARNLKDAGFRFLFQGSAIVMWPQRENAYEAFKQFFNYATGDGQAFYIRSKTPFLFLRVILGIFLFFTLRKLFFLILLIYFIWAFAKNFRYVGNLSAFFWLPLLQVLSDVAVSIGFLYGLFIKKWTIGKK